MTRSLDHSSDRIGRRSVIVSSVLLASPVYALLSEIAVAEPSVDGRISARRWVDRQDELARGLRSGAVPQTEWHDEVNRLGRDVDVGQLLAETRVMDAAGAPFRRDPVKRSVHFLDEEGRSRKLAYAAATFTFGPENVITPHAHQHMASAHMVVAGKVRIRTFDRLGGDANSITIRPTGDRVGAVGSAAAMTTAKDNIHWFTPASASAVTFDVIVDGLDAGEVDYLIQPVDPLDGELMPDGAIVAPILSFEESMRRYTAHV